MSFRYFLKFVSVAVVGFAWNTCHCGTIPAPQSIDVVDTLAQDWQQNSDDSFADWYTSRALDLVHSIRPDFKNPSENEQELDIEVLKEIANTATEHASTWQSFVNAFKKYKKEERVSLSEQELNTIIDELKNNFENRTFEVFTQKNLQEITQAMQEALSTHTTASGFTEKDISRLIDMGMERADTPRAIALLNKHKTRITVTDDGQLTAGRPNLFDNVKQAKQKAEQWLEIISKAYDEADQIFTDETLDAVKEMQPDAEMEFKFIHQLGRLYHKTLDQRIIPKYPEQVIMLAELIKEHGSSKVSLAKVTHDAIIYLEEAGHERPESTQDYIKRFKPFIGDEDYKSEEFEVDLNSFVLKISDNKLSQEYKNELAEYLKANQPAKDLSDEEKILRGAAMQSLKLSPKNKYGKILKSFMYGEKGAGGLEQNTFEKELEQAKKRLIKNHKGERMPGQYDGPILRAVLLPLWAHYRRFINVDPSMAISTLKTIKNVMRSNEYADDLKEFWLSVYKSDKAPDQESIVNQIPSLLKKISSIKEGKLAQTPLVPPHEKTSEQERMDFIKPTEEMLDKAQQASQSDNLTETTTTTTT